MEGQFEASHTRGSFQPSIISVADECNVAKLPLLTDSRMVFKYSRHNIRVYARAFPQISYADLRLETRANALNINILLIAGKKIARYILHPILLDTYDIYGISP